MQAPRLQQVVDVLDAQYDPRTAATWDAVGLVAGDPALEVTRVLLAVDPVGAVVDEAVAWGADLLLTHHPLFLRPVHGVAATTPKGALVHRLLTHGVALHVAHTNADHASPGVSDALADVLGLSDLAPLRAEPAEAPDVLAVYVPLGHVDAVVSALADARAGALGDYDRCAYMIEGTGTFRPLPGADPAVGTVGKVELVAETRVEMVVPSRRVPEVVAALRATHPYEEPAFHVVRAAPRPGPTGVGRTGVLPRPEPLAAFAARVAAALPATAQGVRVAGDPERLVRRVAVCGGAGDDLFDDVRRAGVDAYVTADLRHHPASEAREHGGPALVDVAHWASEWPWLPVAARMLVRELRALGTTVETRVSTVRTDPWDLAVASPTVPPQTGERP